MLIRKGKMALAQELESGRAVSQVARFSSLFESPEEHFTFPLRLNTYSLGGLGKPYYRLYRIGKYRAFPLSAFVGPASGG